MTVRLVDTTPRPSVYGEGGPVLRASFHTGGAEELYLIGAVMPCAPGDFESLLLDDNAQREAGVILPGDEGAGLEPDPRDRPAGTTPPSSGTQG
ncbi:hypothetical protein ACH61_03265 [Rathayibacter tanaceti]|uniref:Uncharacterized protein n=2 Tax=Rathayibacter tanaceti TaxID=1671680 RepID=A0A162FUE1_9MICO|nr:hypothetical protein ACH61_03265 [Rathayibacter tanaceti]